MTRVVKGVSRNVIVVKSPGGGAFQEAIFIVNDEAKARGASGEMIVKEAQDIAARYMKDSRREGKRRLGSLFFFCAGSAATGLLWLASELVHILA